MTSGHLLFIPGMIVIGFMFGFVFGARAARDQANLERKRAETGEATRAERAARRAGRSEPDRSEPAAAEPKQD